MGREGWGGEGKRGGEDKRGGEGRRNQDNNWSMELKELGKLLCVM